MKIFTIIILGIFMIGLLTAGTLTITYDKYTKLTTLSKELICDKLNILSIVKTECNVDKKTNSLSPVEVKGKLSIDKLETKEGVIYKVYSK